MDTPLILTVILAVTALLIPPLDALLRGGARGKASGYVSIAGILLSIGFILYALVTPTRLATALPMFRNDLLGLFFSLAVLTVSLLVAASSLEYMKGDPNVPIYYSLLLFTSLGMVLLAFAADLLLIIVAWELMSLPTYVLTGFRKRNPDSVEAALKYFILGAFSSGVLLYAVSLTYGLTGSTSIFVVFDALRELTPLSLLALALFIAGFGLKMSVVPFHMWIPDAYEGAPPTVSALLSAATKKAGFAAALRVFLIALPLLRVEWTSAFAILAIATMTLGNIAALTQRVFPRMLAYSSIAQAGYMLIGLSVAPYTGSSVSLGVIGLLFHVFNHAVMQSTAFIAVAAVSYTLAKTHLDGYNGLAKRMPVTALTLTIALLALAGVPPLNGFWSKLVLFAAAVESGGTVWWGGWLATAGILNSAFSLGYYAWVIKRMYLDEPEGSVRVTESTAFNVILVAATLLIIVTGVFPSLIYEPARWAAAGL